MEGRSSVYGACYWIRVHAVRVRSRKIRNAVFNHTPKRSENFFLRVGKLRKASFQENLLQLSIVEPYRKPTQVCRSRRPRRTGEGRSESFSGDCLSKTQLPANSQEDV